MNAKKLRKKHDPNKYGEFSNDNYIDMYVYAEGLENQLSKAENLPISDVIDWNPADVKPEYDGDYLCFIEQPQECGNVWKYQKVVKLQFNQWVEEEIGEVVRYWQPLPNNDSCL